jgi:hypothetical protein
MTTKLTQEQIHHASGSTAALAAITGVAGECGLDTTKGTAVVFDGATPGGRAMLREDIANLTTTPKATPVNADLLLLSDSADGGKPKWLSWSDLKSTLKTYFDTLYLTVSGAITNLKGGNNTTLLGSIPYQSNTDTTTLLAPNTTATKKFLRQTGTGTNGAAPAWDTIVDGDLPTAIAGKTITNSSIGSSNPSTGVFTTLTATGKTVIGSGTGQYSGLNVDGNYTGNYILALRNTSATDPLGFWLNYSGMAPNDTGHLFIGCYDGAYRFYVTSNGGIANYQANNTNLSDRRVKKDITPAKSYLPIIRQIPVVTFLYNDQTDTDLNLGAIAQDIDAVAPELINRGGWGPDDQQKLLSVYETDLKYALMKCIQELADKNDALESRLAALEARS